MHEVDSLPGHGGHKASDLGKQNGSSNVPARPTPTQKAPTIRGILVRFGFKERKIVLFQECLTSSIRSHKKPTLSYKDGHPIGPLPELTLLG